MSSPSRWRSGLDDVARAGRARVWGLRSATVGRARSIRERRTSAPSAEPRWGVNVFGYFGSVLGLGQGARAMIDALREQRILVAPVEIEGGFRQSSHLSPVSDLRTVPPGAAPFAVNLFYTNGDGMRGVIREHGRRILSNRYSIGVWWWEVAPAPIRWAAASRSLDELWTCSEHVRAALAPVSERPVFSLDQPIPVPMASAESRRELGLPDGFLFHTSFDYESTLARKNPIGVVEAFRQAFPEGSGASLFIRSTNGHLYQRQRRTLEAAAAGHQDIHIADRYLSEMSKNAMLAHCDCYVSLHRAEGFGLTLAEAMRLGKPVVATGWSGNLEFMTSRNSFLVDYSLCKVGAGAWPYPAAGQWADPDLGHAAERMREVFEDRVAAAAKAALAAEDLRRYDPSAVGRLMAARLNAIRDRL